MSAKGRDRKQKKLAFAEGDNPHEFYRTPAWATRAILPLLGRPSTTIDLGCGDGAIGKALRDAWGDGCAIDGWELDPKRALAATHATTDAGVQVYNDVLEDDLLKIDPADYAGNDLIISNPPYSHAEAFARVALQLVRPGGLVAFLLRLAFVEGQKRVAFHREFPSDVHVLAARPSFNGMGTDSAAYAWFVWGLGRGGRWSVLEGAP